uniref:Glucose dehydrogenase [acceptor] n=2 Tax=Lygus hesperus TaxID=30085 RepID=A0A146M9T9_LYGHE
MAECECRFEDTSYLGGTCRGGDNVTMLLSLVDLLIRSNCHIAEPCKRSRLLETDQEMFDFIVVGGGVAGPVVASRLSDNKRWKVALFEAGPEEATTTLVPAFAFTGINSSLDWDIKTEKHNKACLAEGGICTWPRGKMIGGTGSLSGMMYNRGHREIFNQWARDGNVGWTYYETLQFFKKSERNIPTDWDERLYHGTKGPMPVTRFPWKPPVLDDFLRAGQEMGYNVGDLNGANQTGFTRAHMMYEDGVRASAARAYLRTGNKKKNLFVLTNSRVTRVVIDKMSKKALGVEYQDARGNHRFAFAKKEVILTAGAVHTPQLLMLSGIGPKAELEKHGIEVISDLKVGRNLHNHVGVGIPFSINQEGLAELLTISNLNQYLENRSGPLASTGMTQLTAFVHSKYSQVIPDIQLFFDGYSAACPAVTSDQVRLMEDGMRRIIYIRPTNILPKSKGYITLRSSDPFDPPKISPFYLSDPHDVNVLIEGIRFAIKLSQASSLRKWGIRMEKIDYPPCDVHKYNSDAYWECIIRHKTGPENHPAGTAKMGTHPEMSAVVDPELRVYGVTNLRVMDASIFPYLPNGNPISVIIMVAEKGAHMLESAWTFC